MSNSYFDFKQMRIEQGNCAMKVSTDACIQGAWTPINAEVKNVLDIGTGTGLLSLMLAQRSDSIHIDAIEIEESAAKQASENIVQSPFNSQINIINTDAKSWNNTTQYDLIICNPPFFTKSLQAENEQRNIARHNDGFSQDDLCKVLVRNLADNGYASILLPVTENNNWLKTAALNGIFVSECLLIKPFAHSKPNRAIWICNKFETAKMSEKTLVIYEHPGIYTAEFTALLRPFYLNL